jgi:hypothetical protein
VELCVLYGTGWTIGRLMDTLHPALTTPDRIKTPNDIRGRRKSLKDFVFIMYYLTPNCFVFKGLQGGAAM